MGKKKQLIWVIFQDPKNECAEVFSAPETHPNHPPDLLRVLEKRAGGSVERVDSRRAEVFSTPEIHPNHPPDLLRVLEKRAGSSVERVDSRPAEVFSTPAGRRSQIADRN